MSNAAMAFLSGLGSGYFSAKDKEREQARQDAKDQRDQEEHDARMEEANQKKRERAALAEAGKPLAVNNGATVTGVAAQPTVYDNVDVASSDVRQANRLAELPAAAQGGIPAPAGMTAAPVVGGKAFADDASAQAAATAGNTPQAIRGRQVAALQGLDPERALRLQAAGTQVEQADQTAADANWRRKVAGAMINGGHQGLADLVSSTEHGPAAGVKLQAVVSPDGKSVTYSKVDADGKLTPTGLTFTNDGDGIARAAAALDGAISPADRVKMLQADAKEKRETIKDTAAANKDDAYAEYLRGAKSEAERARAAGGGKTDHKMDEDEKLRLNEASKGVQEATKAYGEALKTLMPGAKPEDSPAVRFAADQLQAARLNHKRVNIQLGQITPDQLATEIMGSARDAKGVLASLEDLANLVGPEIVDQVAIKVKATDAYKRMDQQSRPPKTPAGKAAAAAPPGSVVLQPNGSYTPAGAKPQPAAAAGPALAAPQAPAAGTPADKAGQRLDTAREVLRRLQASAPGLAKGRQALDEHAEAVNAARADLRDAEAAYQRMIQGQLHPTFSDTRPQAAQGAL